MVVLLSVGEKCGSLTKVDWFVNENHRVPIPEFSSRCLPICPDLPDRSLYIPMYSPFEHRMDISGHNGIPMVLFDNSLFLTLHPFFSPDGKTSIFCFFVSHRDPDGSRSDLSGFPDGVPLHLF